MGPIITNKRTICLSSSWQLSSYWVSGHAKVMANYITPNSKQYLLQTGHTIDSKSHAIFSLFQQGDV